MSIFEHIQDLTRQESSRLNHYYLGVEHLFLGLIRLENSLTASVLKQHHLAPEFVRYVLEEKLGQSPDRRYWEGYRLTPRYENVLTTAQSYSASPGERELLLAILDEGDNVPVRVLQSLNIDIASLSESAANWTGDLPPTPPDYPEIESELPLLAAEKSILQEMFIGFETIKVERELAGSDYPTRVYVVNTGTDTALIRFDHPAAIIREKRRYDTLIRDRLSPNLIAVADVSDFVIADHHPLGGIKYTSAESDLTDLQAYVQQHGLGQLGDIIREQIYEKLKHQWWIKRARYQMQMWREYETILPPALVVDVQSITADTVVHPLGTWSKDDNIAVGTPVKLEDFTIHRILPHRHSIHLCAGPGDESVNTASKVEVNALDYSSLTKFSEGQSVRRIQGSVTRTRKVILMEQVMALNPDFSIMSAEFHTPLGGLPNPITILPNLLAHEAEVFLAPIHGNLHPGNIIMDSSANSWLVDFTQVRTGHILFDWAVLEAIIMEQFIAPQLAGDWASVWEMTSLLYEQADEEVVTPIAAVREVVNELLAVPGDWREYFAPLCMVCLSRLGKGSLTARRLAFAVAATAANIFVQLNLHVPVDDFDE